MKRFRRSRDDGRFAVTTLQNPTIEVRSRSELIAAAQKNVAEEACPPRRDVACVSHVSPAQNSACPAEVLPPQPDSPDKRHNNAHRRNPFPVRREVRLYRRVKWNSLCLRRNRASSLRSDPCRRHPARLAKHFAEERGKASLAAATKSPASPEIIAPDKVSPRPSRTSQTQFP